MPPHPWMRLGVAAHARPGMDHVGDRSRRGNHRDRPIGAVVVRHVVVGKVEHRVVGARGRHAVGAIQHVLRLGIAVAEVGHEAPVGNDQPQSNPVAQRLVAGILHVALEGVFAVGDGANLVPHPPLGIVEQLVADLGDALDAVDIQQLVGALLGHVQRRHHGVQVAPRVSRRAVVRHHDAPHVLVVFAAAHQPHRRQPQALLVDLGGGGCEPADGQAADFNQMGDVRDVAEDLAVVVDRLDDHVLRHVDAAPVGGRCAR